MKRLNRKPRLQLRQRQSLTIKQKLRYATIIAFSIAIPIGLIVFIYMNLGNFFDAHAATTYTWKGNTSNDWNTASNWSPNGVPTAADKIIINNGTGANWPRFAGNITTDNITMSAGTIDLNGYTLTIATVGFTGCTVSNGNIVAASFSGISSTILNSVTLEKTGSTANTFNGGNTFNGAVTFKQTGNGVWTFSNSTGDTYNGAVTIYNNSASGTLNFAQNGSTTVNDNITINNTSTGGVHFGAGSGSATFALDKCILAGTFANGPLTLNRVMQSGTATSDMSLSLTALTSINATLISGISATCTAAATLTGTTIRRKFVIRAADVVLNNANNLATSAGMVSITKTAGGANAWTGGNTFGSGTDTVVIVNKGAGSITIGNTTGDTYNASLIMFADSAASSALHVGFNGTSVFNGNVILTNTSTGGITFGNGSGSSTFAANKTISANTYTSGPLTINRSVQSGTTAFNFIAQPTILTILNSTMIGDFNVAAISTSTVSGSTFKKSFILSGSQVALNNANSFGTESGDVTITKTGATANAWTGGNTFGAAGSTTTITNSGTATLTMANSNGDTFNGNVILKQTSSGVLSAVTNATSYFRGNLSTDGSTASINFGTGSGIVEMRGTSPQTISGSSTYLPTIRKLTINNNRNGVTLNVPVRISLDLTMTSGNIYTSSANLLTIGTGIASIVGASDSSYIEGPLRKTGNQIFAFPVGKNGIIRFMGMSAPTSATDQFTAEYFSADPSVSIGATKDATLHHISNSEYWTFSRNTGTSAVIIALSWSSASGGVSVLSEMRLARWDATLLRWSSVGAVNPVGNVVSGYLAMNSTTTSFGTFTFGSSTSNNALPIELISFTVEPEGSKAKVNWRTGSERDNDFFTIERSRDGRNFEILGTMRGAGTSVEPLDYSFTDDNPLSEISYYRLKQTDYNGHFEYFGPKSLSMEKTEAAFHIVSVNPNPFTDLLNIKYFSPEEMEATLKVLRVNGTEVLSQNINLEQGERIYTMYDVGSFTPGIYIIALTSHDKMLATYRVVKK